MTAGAWKGGDPRLVKTSNEPRFLKVAPGAVNFVPVSTSTIVLGWLWFDDPSGSAHYIANASSGSRGNNAGVVWVGGLSNAKARNLLPSQAIAEFADLGSDELIGGDDLSAVARAESVEEILVIAKK